MDNIDLFPPQPPIDAVALNFFRKVLPMSGRYSAATKKKKIVGDDVFDNKFFDSIDKMWEHLRERDNDGRECYFTLATFGDVLQRTVANVFQLKAFSLDVDFGEAGHKSPGYPTMEEAKNALVAFCKALNLSAPIVVTSGGGLQAHWPLEEAISREKWQRYTTGLQAACHAHGLKADPGLTVNAAHIMRPPGTTNRKLKVPRPVQVWMLDAGPYPLDKFAVLLNYTKRSAPVSGPPIPPRPEYLGAYQSNPEAFPDRYELVDIDSLAAECAVVAQFQVTGDCSEPVWMRMANLFHYVKDGERLFHEFSERNYPDYGRLKAQAKYDRAAGLTGPPLCSGMRDGTDGETRAICLACPHLDRIVTPLALGRSDEPVESADDDTAKGRPSINIVGGGLSQAANEAEQALLGSGEPIYSRGGALVRPISEEVRAADITMPDGQPVKRTTTAARLQTFNEAILSDCLCETAFFQKYNMLMKKWVRIDPPERVTRTILSRGGRGKFPQIAGLITTPTLRPDYSILAEPGYDAETQLYHVLDPGLKMPNMPETPSRAEAVEAIGLLRDLLTGFPFVIPIDQAVALSGIMTAVLRGALSVAPLHGFSAPTAGSGKSFLADVAATIATGRLCPVIAAGKTEEETEKRLGALIHAGAPIINIDNVSGELGGDMLCQLTERGKVHVRILGKSEAPEVDCKSMVFATGNGLTIAGDMVRRTVLCRLDPKVEQPELRNFPFDPIARILQNRGAYVAACLTIALAHKAAGAPTVCGHLASYEGWSAMVRAPLIWLGEADPVASVEKIREGDPELSAIRELFAMWPENFGKIEPLTAATIIEIATERQPSVTYGATTKFVHPELHDLLVRRAGTGNGAGNQISSKSLGRWLKAVAEGKIVGGLRLELDASKGHGNRFCLRPARAG